jgi:hypothetical protein
MRNLLLLFVVPCALLIVAPSVILAGFPYGGSALIGLGLVVLFISMAITGPGSGDGPQETLPAVGLVACLLLVLGTLVAVVAGALS